MNQSSYAKMVYLIRRRKNVSRDELVMHWFKNHMPAVIESNMRASGKNRAGANRYIAQLFSSKPTERPVWDGLAQLWFHEPHPPMKHPAGVPQPIPFKKKQNHTGIGH